ncbi:hypothetical protein EN836_16740 [Mesorhizobium sp. M1C.F.Ca.ET.193.01.1.1]|nr:MULTISPECIES: hypothetical protein [unclassified Mesorhizobium]TGS99012.1 hypothetical protein EN820_35470 [bacterium M00.F.Ca.ET.177.01.1.1]TGQ53053.1 hypothetical protein EN853_16735 [Mesorhizobium sp. M1C.F.Ca.ET.210.01.1.1]TGQ70331.1 hypothetical protein EN855_016745 [Mesorhizobium sp. M1C.F.Ca.ET.212.01.1.1]TGR06661.1 hypothetical protein EN847_16740 [Mesorhizobium sp. M1C.F.Ca.ET.204.01.1.1]TGR27184.1 hypothetical protein EN839_16740 [Mesorhizobium sp. M1C.F.Ca.ET.196.01.1.1]
MQKKRLIGFYGRRLRDNEKAVHSENMISETEARRDFLKKAGRFAVVTPPAITLLLGTSLRSKAIAKSGGSHGHHGPPPPPHGK